ncbi:ERF family protein [Streptosporangium sp. NPDC002544]|uniref:ERF family protein n=1 Tax=Streptosporangium sp. NPDC002544 TaxID=3154538 RepID=UPI00332C682C
MTSLQERAAQMARTTDQPAEPPSAARPDYDEPRVDEPLPDIDVEVPEGGPAQVPVHVAWANVMGQVRAVAKEDKVTEGPRFVYRGVDRALNVFGPVCRAHGVLVLPHRVEAAYRDTKTSTGKPTRECTVLVTYRIYGPMGDHLETQAAGESLDTGDKGSAKAQAVALRTLLFHAGLVPTQDPDPDSHNIERGEAVVRSAASYVEEICNPRTSVQRLLQIKYELTQTGQMGALVTNETGDDEQIGAMVNRIGKERSTGGAQ